MIKKTLFTAIALSMLSMPVMAAPSPEDDSTINVPTSENPVIRKLENPDMPDRNAIPDIDQTGNTKPVPQKHRVVARPHIFTNIDTNKDGKISREEFNATGDAARFVTADADADGIISEAEFNKYFNDVQKK